MDGFKVASKSEDYLIAPGTSMPHKESHRWGGNAKLYWSLSPSTRICATLKITIFFTRTKANQSA